MSEHKFHKCDKDGCIICEGGLSDCEVCGGCEGWLPTECPGYKCEYEELERVGKGLADFIGGEWFYFP